MPQSFDNPLRGVLFMCAGMFVGSMIDISVKTLRADYATAEIVLLRSLIALPIVLLVVHRQSGLRALVTSRWPWQLYRALLMAGSIFGFFYALAHVELVTAMLLGHVSPVLIVLLARPLLGERVGLYQWAGIVVAMAGVAVVLRPDRLHLDPAALAVIGSAACWALVSISNRRLAGVETPGVLTFYTLPVSTLLALILIWDEFIWPKGWDWALFAIAGIASTTVHYLLALAYRYAKASTIAPFEYTTLVWAALAGYVFWGEIPSGLIWLGGGAVIVGGYIALQSRS